MERGSFPAGSATARASISARMRTVSPVLPPRSLKAAPVSTGSGSLSIASGAKARAISSVVLRSAPLGSAFSCRLRRREMISPPQSFFISL